MVDEWRVEELPVVLPSEAIRNEQKQGLVGVERIVWNAVVSFFWWQKK